MKYIEDLRDLYRGEGIWVIGAGASLDDYPIDFFEDEICVGMNWGFSVFVDIGDGIEKFNHRAFYSVHQHVPPVDWLVANLPGFLENCFFLLPPDTHRSALCTPNAGDRHSVWWEDYKDFDIHYMRWGICGPNYVSATKQDFADVAEHIANGRACEYVSAGTTMNWAVQAAAVLGASKIYLAGCEGVGGYVSKQGYIGHGTPHGLNPAWIRGIENLTEVFASHGVDIVHYYFDEEKDVRAASGLSSRSHLRRGGADGSSDRATQPLGF